MERLIDIKIDFMWILIMGRLVYFIKWKLIGIFCIIKKRGNV